MILLRFFVPHQLHLFFFKKALAKTLICVTIILNIKSGGKSGFNHLCNSSDSLFLTAGENFIVFLSKLREQEARFAHLISRQRSCATGSKSGVFGNIASVWLLTSYYLQKQEKK